jgi:ABC-2 type transport system ATP-binding protein
MAPAIETKGLQKTYKVGFFQNKHVRALQGLDLTIEPGQVYGLIGPNGAGKSTTIKILMDLVQASAGTAKLFGLNVREREARRQVGFVPENPAPYEYLTGRELVTLSGNLCGLSGKELSDRTQRVIDLVEMTRAADLQIRRYSKGMTQRVALAQALVSQPKLLILDEPTSGLDPLGRRHIRDLILQERQKGTTILFCTHIIADVEALCDRLVVLVGGKQVREGSVAELITGGGQTVELMLEGLTAEQLATIALPSDGVQEVSGRLLVRVNEGELQQWLRAVLDKGGKVARIQPVRFSLEDLFMSALKESTHGPVGGEITE